MIETGMFGLEDLYVSVRYLMMLKGARAERKERETSGTPDRSGGQQEPLYMLLILQRTKRMPRIINSTPIS